VTPMRLLLSLTLAAYASCSNGVNNGVKTMDEKLATCTSLAECKTHEGQRVHVVGTYAVWDPLPTRARNHPPAQQVVLQFGPDEDGPYLGAWGHDGHLRPLDEIARYRGKQVRVTGTFRSSMPPHPTDPPEAASVDGPCIYPVEQIAPAE
jgi:hypothetical protein